MTRKKRKFNVIDLFAGCGGLTDGFEQSGLYNTIACVEWDKTCCNTLINRLKSKWGYADANKRVLRYDIQKTKKLFFGWENEEKYGSSDGIDSLLKDGESVDVIIGGPPCQAYSVAGRIRDTNNMSNDYRNYLFENYIEMVKHYKPNLIIFENVPGMLSATPGGTPIIPKIKEAFFSAGYEIIDDLKSSAIVDVSEYGVPQLRRRIIILGVKRGFFNGKEKEALNDFYSNILPSYKVDKIPTVAEAIFDLPKIKPVSDSNKKISHNLISKGVSFLNHIPRFHSERDITIFKELAQDLTMENRKYKNTQDLKDLYFEKTGKRSNIHKYFVLSPDKPSNTIVSHLKKDGLRHIHPDPDQARSITPREAARLQSFPDDFEFLGPVGEQYKMIGNAVPPKMALIIAKSINQLVDKYA